MASKRIEKTKREIKEAFLELLEKKNIIKITVAEIVNLAEVSRATFYLHFDDIYAVYDSICMDIKSELYKIFISSSGVNPKEVLINRVNMSIDYISENENLIVKMAKNGNIVGKVHEGASEAFIKEFYPNGSTNYGHVEVNFVTWGLLGVLNDWIERKYPLNKDEVKVIIMHILARFIPGATE